MRQKRYLAYYHPKSEPNALERLLNAILGTGPLPPASGERWLQLRFQSAAAPWELMLALAVSRSSRIVTAMW